MGRSVFYWLMPENISIQIKRLWNKTTTPLCFINVSKDFAVNNKKAWLNGYVYDFSVDYNNICITDIINIYKYLMKKHDIK